jgi:AraC-like DNA-binding protein
LVSDARSLGGRLAGHLPARPDFLLAWPETPGEDCGTTPDTVRASRTARRPASRVPAPPASDNHDDALALLRRGLRLHTRLDYMGGVCGPWAIDHNSATAIWLHLVTRGDGYAHSPAWPRPLHLEEGDLVLFLPHARRHYLAYSAGAPVFGAPGAAKVPLEDGPTGLVCALIELVTPNSPLWRALPAEIVLRRGEGGGPLARLVELIVAEALTPGFASESLIERLFDACFVLVLRHCVEAGLVRAGALAAFQDRRVARVLGLMHAEPARAWTVNDLAATAGVSRTVLNERFTTVVGSAPMEYLAALRMHLAATWLVQPGTSVEAVAARCGYDSASAFSRMFRRHRGMSPGAWRRRRGAPA